MATSYRAISESLKLAERDLQLLKQVADQKRGQESRDEQKRPDNRSE